MMRSVLRRVPRVYNPMSRPIAALPFLTSVAAARRAGAAAIATPARGPASTPRSMFAKAPVSRLLSPDYWGRLFDEQDD